MQSRAQLGALGHAVEPQRRRGRGVVASRRIIVGEQNGQWIMRSGNDGRRVRTRPLSTRGVIAIRRGGGSYAGAYASARHDQAHTTERRAQRPVTRATREVALYDRQDERSAERFNERADDRFAQNYASVARQRDRRVGYRHARYLSARGVRRVSQREQTIDVPHATSPVACDGSMRRVDQPDRYLSAGLRPQRPRAYR